MLHLAPYLLSLVTMPVLDRLRFESAYDPDADVLYVTWGDAPTTHGVEVQPGVIARLTDTDQFEGLTVYDVTRYFSFDPHGNVDQQASAIVGRYLATLDASAILGGAPAHRADRR